jgi:hypothetical protein
MSGFDELRSAKPARGRGCIRCGAAVDGQIKLLLLESGQKVVTSKSGSFCEPCAAKTYRRMLAAFELEVEQGPVTPPSERREPS